jgi:hypothetical protein
MQSKDYNPFEQYHIELTELKWPYEKLILLRTAKDIVLLLTELLCVLKKS